MTGVPTSIIEAAISGAFASGGVVSAAAWWFDKKEKVRANKADEIEKERLRQRKMDDKWFEEAAQAYERVEKKCDKCAEELEAVNRRLYKLIASLDDMCDSSNGGMVKASDLRAAVRIARREP